MLIQSAGIAGALFYLASALMLSRRFIAGESFTSPGFSRVSYLAVIGVLLHGLVLYQTVITSVGLQLGIFNAFSSAAWLVVVLLLLTTALRPIENLGILVYPVGALAIAIALLFRSDAVIPPEQGVGIETHIFLAILAYSVLTIAALQSLLVWYQDRQLRTRHPGNILRTLPPLQSMETLLFELIAIGFIVLTAAIISGWLYLEDMFAQHLAHKTILTLIAWGLFATLLFGRWRFGWRGRAAIRWTLSGFAVLVVGFLGSKLVLELILN